VLSDPCQCHRRFLPKRKAIFTFCGAPLRVETNLADGGYAFHKAMEGRRRVKEN
jgi:hypothetical protein